MTEDARLAVLEKQMDNLEKKMDAGFAASEQRHADLRKLMTDFIEKSEDKFASKWVEDGVKWAVSLVLGAVLLAVVYLVVKK